jgi:hypothetical protein
VARGWFDNNKLFIGVFTKRPVLGSLILSLLLGIDQELNLYLLRPGIEYKVISDISFREE